ncbi:AAA family ATPase [Streptomyces sp. NPDC002285]
MIVGENGVGKSNLLEAIRLVLDPSLSDARRMRREEDIWEGHPRGLGRRSRSDDRGGALSRCRWRGGLTLCQGVVGPGGGPGVRPWWVDRRRR